MCLPLQFLFLSYLKSYLNCVDGLRWQQNRPCTRCTFNYSIDSIKELMERHADISTRNYHVINAKVAPAYNSYTPHTPHTCLVALATTRRDALHYSPQHTPHLWEKHNGSTLIRSQCWGGYICPGPADTLPQKAMQGMSRYLWYRAQPRYATESNTSVECGVLHW